MPLDANGDFSNDPEALARRYSTGPQQEGVRKEAIRRLALKQQSPTAGADQYQAVQKNAATARAGAEKATGMSMGPARDYGGLGYLQAQERNAGVDQSNAEKDSAYDNFNQADDWDTRQGVLQEAIRSKAIQENRLRDQAERDQQLRYLKMGLGVASTVAGMPPGLLTGGGTDDMEAMRQKAIAERKAKGGY